VDCFVLVKPINREVYTRSLHWRAVDGVGWEWFKNKNKIDSHRKQLSSLMTSPLL